MSDYNKRPVYLDLLHIRLPVGAVISILHRVSGVLLVLLLPAALYLLQLSLSGAEAYAQVTGMLSSLPGRVLLFSAALILTHHLFAGLRHLLLDLDVGISRAASRRSAWLVSALVAAAGFLIAWRLFL